jgi:hypothetical protein
MIHPSRKGIICDISGKSVLAKAGKIEYYSVSIDRISDANGDDHELDLDISEKVFKKWQEKTKTPRCAFCGQECITSHGITEFNKVEILRVSTVKDGATTTEPAFLKKMCSKCLDELKEEMMRVIKDREKK